MIAKIRRGQKMAGLVTYLLGPGEHNEHRDRHIIAGSPTVMRDMWLGHFDGPGDNEASRETALEVAGEVEIPRRLYQTEVKMKARPVAVGVGGRELGLDVIEPARRGEKGTYRNAPVWHCVLSLMPGEELTDEKWQKVAEAFMDRMGFEGTPDGKTAPARWVAVRHGLSGEHGEGQDHIHIAASLVREDGRKVSTYDYGPGKAKGDWKRADEVCGELEHEFGLQILTSRREGGGMSENSRAELERQKALGTPETERERLRRMVRAVATAADSETEFVRGLRGAGIAVRPRYETGGTAAVNGYSVRLRRNGVEVGPWLGGGKLAKDLTLTALREQQWVDSVEGREDALAAWMNPTEKSERVGWARSEDIEAWKEAGRAAGQWQERLRQIPHHDRAQWAYIAGQAAGAFAAWSETFEGDKPGPFAAAANELARSAQLQRASQRYRPLPAANPLPGASGMGNRSAFGDMARLLLSHPQNALPRSHQLRGRDDDAAIEVAALLLLVMFLLLAMLIAIAVEVARAHRARGELGRAVAVEHMARQHLNPVQTQWESELDARRTQWDRDAAQVFTALAGRAAQRVVDRKSAVESDAAQRDPRTPTEQQNQEAAAAPATRRAYYTELTPDVRAGLRAAAIASRAFGDGDLDPRSWHDEMLDAELAHRRAEIQVLIDDIAERQAGNGTHTRQARAANAALTRKATTIPGAQDAAQAVAEAARTVAELTTKLVKLRREFEETSRIRVRTRTQLQTDIDATEQELRTLKPQLPQLKTAARTAAAATGVPEEQWDEVVFEASERQQRQRMAAAQSQDQRDIGEDASYLRTLQRELGQVETEHARRATLTPEQREHEARTERDRTRTRRPMNPALGTWDGTDVSNPGPNFGHGTSRGQDQGLDL